MAFMEALQLLSVEMGEQHVLILEVWSLEYEHVLSCQRCHER